MDTDQLFVFLQAMEILVIAAGVGTFLGMFGAAPPELNAVRCRSVPTKRRTQQDGLSVHLSAPLEPLRK
jgi:hypothetical protein